MNTAQMDIGKIITTTDVNLVITLVELVTSKEVQMIVILVPPHTTYMTELADILAQMDISVMMKRISVNNVNQNVLLALD